MIVLTSLVACTPADPPVRRGGGDGPPDDTDPPVVLTTGDTSDTATLAATGDTATEPTVDCSLLVAAGAATWTVSSSITTEEDFDFDGQGYLLMQRAWDLQGVDRSGASHPIAPNTGDPTGIRSTAAGLVAVAHPSYGKIDLVDPTTGGTLTLLSGLSSPNGVEAGADGMIYVTEATNNGRVRMVDPTDGSFVVVAEVPYPNGVVLSPDEGTLYFTSGTTPFGGETHIAAIARDVDGRWDPTTLEIVYTHPSYVSSITMDACGNLYALEYSGGRVLRLDTLTGAAEPFVDLPQGGSWSALHFSPGLGGWDLNALYVTNRSELFSIDTGVPGSHVLTP